MCGGDALGCYWSNRLVTIGDAVYSVSAEKWRCTNTGTSRLQSGQRALARRRLGHEALGLLRRHLRARRGRFRLSRRRGLVVSTESRRSVRRGVPRHGGDEPRRFGLHLVSRRRELLPRRDCVEGSRSRRPASVDAPATRAVVGRFRPKGPKTWTLKVTTPLDGSLEARLTMPPGTLYDISLLSADGKTLFARSLWAGVGEKTLAFQVCGPRSLLLRVVRKGEPGRFRVAFSKP